jgi:hypothetical protein
VALERVVHLEPDAHALQAAVVGVDLVPGTFIPSLQSST